MASPYIQLSKRMTPDETGRCRLRIWVSGTSNNIPPQVFMYQWVPAVPLTSPSDSSMFVAVCTYADIIRLPVGVPEDVQHPFYRRGSVDLLFSSQGVAQFYWERIAGMVSQTVEDFCRLNSLPPPEFVEVTA